MTNVLEEEFFAVEGRPRPGASPAVAYVSRAECTPTGDRITTEERAALWYLAYWAMDGITRPSLAALSMHIDRDLRDTRRILMDLMLKGVLVWLGPGEVGRDDVHVYKFAECGESTAG